MVRIIATFFGIAALSYSAISQTYDVRHDSKLDTPVSLSVKYGPIREVLKSLSKKVGVPVDATTAIADLKVTIFAKKVPCNVILDRIGSVLDCQWQNDQGNRLLVQSRSTLSEMTKYLAAEDLVLRKKAEQEVNHLMQPDQTPAPTDTDPNANGNQPRMVRRGYLGVNMSLAGGELAKLLGDSPANMDSFWGGTILHYEVPDNSSNPNLDAQTIPGRRQRRSQTSGGAATVIYARYDYLGTHDLQFGTSRAPVTSQRFFVPALTTSSGSLAQTAYGKKILAWSSLDLDDSEAAAFNQPLIDPATQVTFQPAKPSTESGNLPQRTQSELLEVLANRGSLPVVSDGFREMLPPEKPDPSGRTPLEWLKAYSQEFEATIQIKDGVATVRQGGFWRLRQYETPEDLLRPMEKNPSSLNLSDYTRLFGSLTPAQARAFQSQNPPKVAFETESILNVIPALRLVGSLPSDFPVNGRPVAVNQLGGDAQALLTSAIEESVFVGNSWQPSQGGRNQVPFYLSCEQANVNLPEGLVPGLAVHIGLPIGAVVSYQIPLRLGS